VSTSAEIAVKIITDFSGVTMLNRICASTCYITEITMS